MIKYIIEKVKWMDINSSLYEKGKENWELIHIVPEEKDIILFYKKNFNDGTIEQR